MLGLGDATIGQRPINDPVGELAGQVGKVLAVTNEQDGSLARRVRSDRFTSCAGFGIVILGRDELACAPAPCSDCEAVGVGTGRRRELLPRWCRVMGVLPTPRGFRAR